MKIYGVALLAICFLLGQMLGEFIGGLINIDGNVGGVGFAMILFIFMQEWMNKRSLVDKESDKGVLFWSSMYIPVVVAMSATQHVKAALTGGWVAVMVGVLGTLVSFALIPLIARMGKSKSDVNDDLTV
ncbi:malonate transporter subunit MadL [Daejeonella sp.]|jgi:malonate transporter MadL subunit|uniref:malonate transporter subunit MadL n=1 Tax=Daejeonella sp. TaxID=2805397 RepID=UPI0037BFD5A9